MRIFLIFLILLVPQGGEETGIISGLVIDGSSSPVAEVKIVAALESGDLCGTSLTDSSGRFSMGNIPEGRIKLTLYHKNYELKTAVVEINSYSREVYRRFQVEKGSGPDLWQVKLEDQLLYQEGVLNLESMMLDKALSLFREFGRKYPYHAKNCFNIGLCYSHLASEARRVRDEARVEEYEKLARKHFHMVLNLYPDHFAATQALAESYVRSRELDEAEELYARLVTVKKDDHYLWYVYGEILSVNDKKSSAIAAYEKVLRLKPGFHRAHARIGNIHMERKDYQKAVRRFEAFLRLAPGTFMTRVTREKLRECQRLMAKEKK